MKRLAILALATALAASCCALAQVAGQGSDTDALATPAKQVLVEFSFKPLEAQAADVRDVTVAGDFNKWSAFANPLVKGKDGVFRAKFRVPAGRHEWRLVINGSWVQDMSTVADRITPKAEKFTAARDGGKNAESSFSLER